jgi:hypothetical protein
VDVIAKQSDPAIVRVEGSAGQGTGFFLTDMSATLGPQT